MTETHIFEIDLKNAQIVEKILNSPSGVSMLTLLVSAAQNHEIIQRRSENLKAWRDLIPTITVYSIGSLIVLSILGIIISTSVNPKATADEKNWARATIVAIGTGAAGFFFGKQDIEKQKFKESEEKK